MATSQRYPIGPFKQPSTIASDDRVRYVEQLAELPETVRAAAGGLSGPQLDTPYRPGGWTVRQVVHHLADSHMHGYVRFRWTLTEDEPVIKAYDHEGWAALEDARHMDIAPSMALLEALHTRWVRLCHSLPDAAWERVFQHPSSGRLSLDEALALYAWHGRHHVAHITTLREREGW